MSFFDPIYNGTRRGNAGKAHSWGIELETNATLTERLSAQFGAGYLEAKYDTYKGAGGPDVDASGNPLRWSLSGGEAYDLPLGKQGKLRPAADAQYQSAIYTSPLNRPQDRSPGQAFVNSTVTWTTPDPRVSVAASVRTVLNSAKPALSSYTPSIGASYLNFPDLRTVLVTLRLRQ